MGKLIMQGLAIVLLLILPFVVLVRGSAYLHEKYHLFPSIALLGGVLFTFIILFIYLTFFFGSGKREGALKRRGVLLLIIILSYCGYGLLYISGKNVKSRGIRSEFRSLHPILRMGVTTLLLLDRSLVVTDADRVPEDYRRMGLKNNSQSLHYRQKDGYVHAVDIRTNGRSMVRNFLTKWYFKGMGFNVLRHVGTADHLHISLLSHDRPYGY